MKPKGLKETTERHQIVECPKCGSEMVAVTYRGIAYTIEDLTVVPPLQGTIERWRCPKCRREIPYGHEEKVKEAK